MKTSDLTVTLTALLAVLLLTVLAGAPPLEARYARSLHDYTSGELARQLAGETSRMLDAARGHGSWHSSHGREAVAVLDRFRRTVGDFERTVTDRRASISTQRREYDRLATDWAPVRRVVDRLRPSRQLDDAYRQASDIMRVLAGRFVGVVTPRIIDYRTAAAEAFEIQRLAAYVHDRALAELKARQVYDRKRAEDTVDRLDDVKDAARNLYKEFTGKDRDREDLLKHTRRLVDRYDRARYGIGDFSPGVREAFDRLGGMIGRMAALFPGDFRPYGTRPEYAPRFDAYFDYENREPATPAHGAPMVSGRLTITYDK